MKSDVSREGQTFSNKLLAENTCSVAEDLYQPFVNEDKKQAHLIPIKILFHFYHNQFSSMTLVVVVVTVRVMKLSGKRIQSKHMERVFYWMTPVKTRRS